MDMLLMISFISPTRLSVHCISERRSPIRRDDTLAAGQTGRERQRVGRSRQHTQAVSAQQQQTGKLQVPVGECKSRWKAVSGQSHNQHPQLPTANNCPGSCCRTSLT